MLLDFLPFYLQLAFSGVDFSNVYEIRFRLNEPVLVKLPNERYYLCKNGLSKNSLDAFVCDRLIIDEIISNLTDNSLYAFNDRIKEGFLTSKNGVRVGITGECVSDGLKIITIKNISSLNIRIPHLINNCADKIFNQLYQNGSIYNSLIVSPPSFGKTTILKDLICRLNNLNCFSILVIDERGEFVDIGGENVDYIKFSDKLYAFNCAIRSMSPSVVITDELVDNNDWRCVKRVSESGVKIVATCHGDSIEKLICNENFCKGVFDRYFILDNVGKPGVLKKVFDCNLCEI